MTFVLGSGSRATLVGVHPSLVRVVERAIHITTQDFSVHEGVRSLEMQREYVRKGVSQTLNSKHLKQPDGFGHAVDLVPFVAGSKRFEWPPIYPIAVAMRQAAEAEGVPLRWGGCWGAVLDITPNAKAMKAAVDAYAAKRRAMKKSAFLDGPHWELI